MTVFMITYCECKNKYCPAEYNKLKADSITYADKLYS